MSCLHAYLAASKLLTLLVDTAHANAHGPLSTPQLRSRSSQRACKPRSHGVAGDARRSAERRCTSRILGTLLSTYTDLGISVQPLQTQPDTDDTSREKARAPTRRINKRPSELTRRCRLT